MEQPDGTPQVQLSFATTGGEGEGSWSHNLQVMKGLSTCLRPFLEHTLLHHFPPPHDLDQSITRTSDVPYVGAKTLGYAKFVAETLKTKPETAERDILCYFVDLQSNDFNTLSNQFTPLVGHGNVEDRTWFAAGVPGTQFGQIFPRSSLHIAITSQTLHYLPEIPQAVLDKSSPAYNKEHVSAHGSSPAAAEAYADASRKGLRRFFKCRTKELVPGGVLAFSCLGRQDRAHPERQMYDDVVINLPRLEKAWRELAYEGLIAEELLHSFNASLCCPSTDELRQAITHPTSAFHFQKLEFLDKFRPVGDDAEETVQRCRVKYAKFLTSLIRGGLGPMLAAHIGPDLTDTLLERFCQHAQNDYPTAKADHFPVYVNLYLAVLIRK